MAVSRRVTGRGVRWEAVLRVNGRSVRRRFPTQRDARDFEAQFRTHVPSGTCVDEAAGRITLHQCRGNSA